MELKKKKSTAKTPCNEEKSYMGIIKGVVGACLVTVVAFVALAALLTYTEISESCIAALSVVITALSAAVSGFFAAKAAKSRGLLWGMLSGVIYVLIVFVVMFSGSQTVNISMGKITGLVCAAAGGGMGGVLGINSKK